MPFSVGVPERTPVPGLRRMPFGSVPDETLHDAASRMPPAVNVALKLASTVPVFVAGFVTVTVWQPMFSVYCDPLPWQPFWSVAVTVMLKLPTSCVVPESVPLLVLNEKPFGSAPDSLKVPVPCPPDCVSCGLKATPAVPVVVEGLVTVMTGQVIVSVLNEKPFGS